jgi:hypothetical protein
VFYKEYEILKKARSQLIRKGTNSLPQELQKDVEEHSRVDDLALGAIIALGALALLTYFGGKDRE